MELINNIAMKHGGVSPGGVGERTREARPRLEFRKRSHRHGDFTKSRALVYGQMTEPPGARLRVGLSALTVAEYFRGDAEERAALSTTCSASRRLVRKCRRFSAAVPSAVGYQPTLLAGSARCGIVHKKGAITSVQAIYVPATLHRSGAGDDLRAPRRDDEPSRQIAELKSTCGRSAGPSSRILDAPPSAEHYNAPGESRFCSAADLQDTPAAILGIDEWWRR
jgi:F-type H+-transporting ATPase subunit beta